MSSNVDAITLFMQNSFSETFGTTDLLEFQIDMLNRKRIHFIESKCNFNEDAFFSFEIYGASEKMSSREYTNRFL